LSHGDEAPSEWVRRFAGLIPAGGRVLDLASGTGRHSRLLRDLGYKVVALDRDVAALKALQGEAGIECLNADVESGPWPFTPRSLDAIVVANYLHRPLFPLIRESLAHDGVLIYETFAAGNERYGRPSNPDFLLRRNELLEEAAPLEIVAFEQGRVSSPRVAVIQRVCAIRGDARGEAPADARGHYPLG
jgi:SAM-dependent methyltransferase